MSLLHNRVDRRILKERLSESTEKRTTISFYKYARIKNVEFFRDHLFIMLDQIDTFGRIYLAHEGINGQISIPAHRMNDLRERLNQITFLEDCRLNVAIEDDGKSFYKLIIKIRQKIVADGITDESFSVADNAVHISAEEYNRLTDTEDTVVIDMRNHYEHEVGHFRGAIRPDVTTFRESLPIVEDILREHQDKHVVMYCTGGIRCEKATAYFKHRGFDNLYQLDGGIIEYTRQAAEQGLENKFIGKNFVFDDRLGERISPDIIAKCHLCGAPCDDHTNCANDACHILMIQCESCRKKFNGCCSTECAEFIKLPAAQRAEERKTRVFNGARFRKGRYHALRANLRSQ
ncbi:MAG: rhodanese-related sulfurtransferase [Bacteroidota bacterium]